MNRKLKEAQEALDTYLPNHPQGVTLDEILKEFGERHIRGPELRAAIWTLRAAGRAKFNKGRVFPATQAA
jgi:hypothetical protein